ncbi:MAG TPA: glycosyltransferase family 39 protein, partial [Kofleriaceae bacterium]
MRLAKLIFIGGIAVWIINAALHCGSGVTLGHDEARYASDTRELLDGRDKRYIYVPSGMNGIALPGVLAGGDERALRVLPMLAGLLFLFAAWRFARRAVGEDAAYWTVGVLAGTHSIVQFNAQLLSDLPSTGCMLAALAILIAELTRDGGPRYRLLAVAPLLAAAFYIRYGSCLTIVLIGLAAIGFGARAIAQRPLLVIVTGLVFIALLVPHLLDSIDQTGSALGIMRASAKVPPRGGSALAGYFLANPIWRYGALAAPLMFVGALA